MEEEIDLRIYIDALLRWWWLIALAAILAGGGAFLVSQMMPPVYEASAGVVSLKSRVDISLGSGFESVTEDDLALSAQVQGSTALLDRNKRRLNTLVGMVENGAIVETVSAELRDMLTEEEADPGALIEDVRSEILTGDGGDSDTIQIIVSNGDPQKAAAIANAWARAFEIHVNSVYGDASYSPFADISAQVATAQVEYDQAQDTLITFMAEENRIAELQRQVEESEAIIANLRDGRIENAAAIIATQVDVQQRIFITTVTAEIGANLTVFEKQQEELLRDFERAYVQLQRLKILLDKADLLRQQLLIGGDDNARTNMLALVSFKVQVFALTDEQPFSRLELMVPSVDALTSESTAAQQIADIDALVKAMEAESSRVEGWIEEQANAFLTGESFQFLVSLSPDQLDVEVLPAGLALQRVADWEGLLPYAAMLEKPFSQEIERLEAQVQGLNAEIVRLRGRRDALQQNRDLTWDAYSNLLSKEQEIRIAITSSESDVRFAVQAFPPRRPVSPKKMVNTAIGLAVGVMGGVFGAFLFSYLGLESRPRLLWRQVLKKRSA